MDDLSARDEGYLSDLPLWSDPKTQEILEEVCKKNNVPLDVITELVVLQRERQHQEKARGIFPRIEEILGRIE